MWPNWREDLAKFGYRPGMKVKTFMNPSYFWLRYLELNQDNLVIFQKTFVEIWLQRKLKKHTVLAILNFFGLISVANCNVFSCQFCEVAKVVTIHRKI
jgi:hypothetical protein